MDEYEQYKAYVASVVAANDGKETIQNKTTSHAGVILAALFGRAVREMRILSGSLNDEAYGCPDVIANTIGFLTRTGTTMTVVLEQEIGVAGNKFLAALQQAGVLGRIVFYNANKKMPFHMALSDNLHYRFEEETDKCEAIAQFGLADLGALNTAFAKVVTEAVRFTPA